MNLEGTVTSTPSLSGDNLYIGVANKLVCVDVKDRNIKWSFATGGVVTSPALVNNMVYTASGDGHLYILNAATGEKLRDIIVDRNITSSPAVANGTVYISSCDGNLYAVK
jgi:outer membrane protein assembly factor BamB